MTGYVALVCRLSPRPDGSYEGVPIQAGWGRDYAARMWPGVPVRVFADAGISAFKDDAYRPEYEAFRAALRNGEVAHVWAVEQTRLERREIPWFELAAELDAAGIPELHTNREGIVRVRDAVAGIKAVLNADEIRKLTRRVNDRLDENAKLGLPSGSRGFGFVHGRNADGVKTLHHVPEQAEVIRWAAEKVLAGWSLMSLETELRARGVKGAHRRKVLDENGEPVLDEKGNPVTRETEITWNTIKSMLTNPTIAGFRVHRKEIVGRGNWEPILDETTWRAVVAAVSGNRLVLRADGKGTYPVTAAHKGNPGSGCKYLMTGGGFTECGPCGAWIYGTPKQMRNKRSELYLICHPKQVAGRPRGKGCVGIMMEPTEQYVVDRMWDYLDQPGFLDAFGADDHAARRDTLAAALADVDRQRNELAGMWTLPAGHPDALTKEEWQAARRALAKREQGLQADLVAVPTPTVGVDIATARSDWPHYTLDEQRAFVRLFVEKVVIHPAKPGTRAFDPDRVDIVWRTL